MRLCSSMVAHCVPIVTANSCKFGQYMCFQSITFMICKRLWLSRQLDHQQTTYFYSIVGLMLSASFIICTALFFNFNIQIIKDLFLGSEATVFLVKTTESIFLLIAADSR